MRIRKHNVGKERWHLSVWTNGWPERHSFENWMREHLPDCMCVYRNPDYESAYIEVRGTNEADAMMILFVWGFNG